MRRIKDEEWPAYRESDGEFFRGLIMAAVMTAPFWLLLYLVWRWVW